MLYLDKAAQGEELQMTFGEIHKLAPNWFEPRLQEQQAEFARAVQRKLAEFAARKPTPQLAVSTQANS